MHIHNTYCETQRIVCTFYSYILLIKLICSTQLVEVTLSSIYVVEEPVTMWCIYPVVVNHARCCDDFQPKVN